MKKGDKHEVYGSKLTLKLILENIPKFRGNIRAVAEACDITVDTVYNYRNHHEEVGAALLSARRAVGDDVKNALIESALAGNTTAQIFYLKTREGWVETKNVNVNADVTNHNIESGSEEEFAEQMAKWKSMEEDVPSEEDSTESG